MYFSGLIEGYNKLMFAANTLSPILLQLEVEHLSNFKITWRGLNQHLFHKLVFTEPKIQKVLPFCISKVNIRCHFIRGIRFRKLCVDYCVWFAVREDEL